MSYIPVYCALCSRATLAEKKAESNALSCGFCERPASVVVGPAYGEQDVLAFAEIERAVGEAVLDRAEAQLLSGRLQQWLDERLPPSVIIQQLMAAIPMLMDARAALFADPQRALGILVATIGARASSANRKSGAFDLTVHGCTAQPDAAKLRRA
jgi:hypothetical protein